MNSWAQDAINRLGKGETVEFRPQGRSMEPLIRSGQLCRVEPAFFGSASNVLLGSIVLATVNGGQYLHCVGATSNTGHIFWYRIENAAGHANGWVLNDRIHGVLVGCYE